MARWLAEEGAGDWDRPLFHRQRHEKPTHDILLGNEIWIVEELHFSSEAMQVKQPAMFWALPINLRGFSGSFCRPVLAIEESPT
jgi:kynurenine formamidase